MPIKYVGRTTYFEGKTLWEILGNLKNFGVGRIVARSIFLKNYPEPSYLKILKVETLPNPKEPSLNDVRKVRVLVEKTFRGQTDPKLIQLESVSYKPDYILIPKDEEAEFCKVTKVHKTDKILPKYMEFPPLLKELIKRDAKLKGEKLEEEPHLEIIYNKKSSKMKYRIANDGEKPDFELPINLGKPISPSLYEGVKL